MTSPKIVVYTAITGGRDPMRDDIPVFTDKLHFETPIMAARYYKTAPHILFPDADWTIWVDGNVFLNKTPEELVAMCKYDVGVLHHTFRDCIYEEAEVCKSAGMDDAAAIDRAVERYSAYFGVPRHDGLAMTMMLIRKNTSYTRTHNQAWWHEICYGSVRDQISFPVIFPQYLYMPTVDFTKNNEFFERVV